MASSEKKKTSSTDNDLSRYLDVLPTISEVQSKKVKFLSDHVPVMSVIPVGQTGMKVITWNCHFPNMGSGYDLEEKGVKEEASEQLDREARIFLALENMIKQQNPDAILLQETFFNNDNLKKKLAELGWAMDRDMQTPTDLEDRRPQSLTLYNTKSIQKATPLTCQVIKVNVPPQQGELDKLPIENAAYVRHGEALYYVNKLEKEITKIDLDAEHIKSFDEKLYAGSTARLLTDAEIALIKSITGHRHIEKHEKLEEKKEATPPSDQKDSAQLKQKPTVTGTINKTLLEFNNIPVVLTNVWLQHNNTMQGVESFAVDTLKQDQTKYSNVTPCYSIVAGDFNQRFNSQADFLVTNVVSSRYRKKAYPCELILASVDPTKKLSSLPIQSCAYVRFDRQLYYVNKQKNECKEIKIENMDRFDKRMHPKTQGRLLSLAELSQIQTITDHEHVGIQGVDWTDGCLYMDKNHQCYQTMKVERLNPETGKVLVVSPPANMSPEQTKELKEFRPVLCCTSADRKKLANTLHSLLATEFAGQNVTASPEDLAELKEIGIYPGMSVNAYREYKTITKLTDVFHFPILADDEHLRVLKDVLLLFAKKQVSPFQSKIIFEFMKNHMDLYKAFNDFKEKLAERNDAENNVNTKKQAFENAKKNAAEERKKHTTDSAEDKAAREKIDKSIAQAERSYLKARESLPVVTVGFSVMQNCDQLVKELKLDNQFVDAPEQTHQFFLSVILASIPTPQAYAMNLELISDFIKSNPELALALLTKVVNPDPRFIEEKAREQEKLELFKCMTMAEVQITLNELVKERKETGGIFKGSKTKELEAQTQQLEQFLTDLKKTKDIKSCFRRIDESLSTGTGKLMGLCNRIDKRRYDFMNQGARKIM